VTAFATESRVIGFLFSIPFLAPDDAFFHLKRIRRDRLFFLAPPDHGCRNHPWIADGPKYGSLFAKCKFEADRNRMENREKALK